MPRIALVTYHKLPQLSPDDQLLQAALERAGARADAVVWDAPGVPWHAYDVVVVRSTWDYHLRASDFHAWIDERERDGVALVNAPRVLRWNAEKTYLEELARRGVAVVPTRWVERGTTSDLATVASSAGWTEVVVKPTVSASAHATWRASAPFDEDTERRFRDEVSVRSLMVQPLLDEVTARGELSLMFIAGRFSHAVRKRPRAGDFRVQAEHGGTAALVDPPDAMVQAAEHALACGPGPTLYARVDGCEVDERFLLMELELLEPSLFFRCAPEAATRLANEILRQAETAPS